MPAETPRPLRLSLKELVDHYDGFLLSQESKSPETRGTYARALREFVAWFAVDKGFRFRTRDVERYRRYLVDRKRLKEVSVGTYMTALRRFCQYLIDIDLLEANPARTVAGGRRPTSHSRTFLTEPEVERLLEAIDTSELIGARDLAIVHLMLDCALGEHEIVHADIGDLLGEGEERRIRVLGKGRTTKDASVPLPPSAAEPLERYLARRFGDEVPSPDAPLVAGSGNRSVGARMTPRGIRSAVNRWLDSSGVKRDRDRRLTPFSLRHTAGLRIVDSGASVQELMRLMRIEWEPTAHQYFRLRGIDPLSRTARQRNEPGA